MKKIRLLFVLLLAQATHSIPVGLLYDHIVPEAIKLPKENDVSSPEIRLKVPVVFYGTKFHSIFVNNNGLLSFQTEIPNFFNIKFPLDYPIIAPFYTNVDTREAGTVSYFETDDPDALARASDIVKDFFNDMEDFEATSLFIVTWFGVGYFNRGRDKINTYQCVVITDGEMSFVEFLYPKDGIQWIQGTGDDSGLPDARAQAGFVSPDGKVFSLIGSGSEQIRNLEVWSNIDLPGQFVYRVDTEEVQEPDNSPEQPNSEPLTCDKAVTYCHVQAECVNYETGVCCKCKKQYYGNGRFCIKKEAHLRVNGKVNGKINGELLDNLDLQSYIVMDDARAYTAISKIPESIGFDIQSLQILGSIIGYLFSKPIRGALNGYQLTGGVFNNTATIKFLNSTQSVIIKQKFLGLDLFDQLKLEAEIQGEIPGLPYDAKVEFDDYEEQYSHTAPGVMQMSSTRSFRFSDKYNRPMTHFFNVEQVFTFDQCRNEPGSVGTTWKLKVGKNFISYESREQIIRFALGSKITPLGDNDPCEQGKLQCMPNSACVVDNDAFHCVCNPGYQHINSGNGTVCADIDECQSGLHSCDYNAQCRNEIGSYSCQCNPGFAGNGQVCENEYSCENVRCNDNAECVESNRVAQCKCMAGFTGDGNSCSPLVDHSCHTANNCHQFAMCTISQETGHYYCACLPGYEGDGYSCEKIEDENNGTSSEPHKEIQRCLLGVCWCPEGLKAEPNTQFCIPNDEEDNSTTTTQTSSDSCQILNNCDKNAQCLYSDETSQYACQCNAGFDGNGYNCQPSTESCTRVNNCDPHATCAYDESLGRSQCVCNPGYAGDGFACRINAICDSDADCSPTEDCLYTQALRYECVCKDGYVRDSQHQCVLPNICGGGHCVENAECLYDDQFQLNYCSCKSGFVGDGIIDCSPQPVGCNIQNKCGLHATCQLDPYTSTYQCQCDQGFYGDGFLCYTEINCHIDPSMCDRDATCVTDANRRYICQCNLGFNGNGTYCKKNPTHDGNFLLLNQGMATLKIGFDAHRSNVDKPIQTRLFQTAVGLDIDCFEGRVYWGDISGTAIRSATYNGSAKTDFITKDIGSPEGLAVDWLSRNIYWTDSTKDTIEVASLDTKRRRVLFRDNLVNPRGIAVHPQRGKIFWSDWDRARPKIEWANADGTGRAIFLQGPSVSLPNSLTIDFDTEHLCYADAGTRKIECVDIDSRSQRTMATNCTYPFGITVTDSHVYWSDWISKKIERVDKASLARLAPLRLPFGGSGNKLYGLVAVPQSCPALTNICQFSRDQCPRQHICLPNGTGSRTCACSFSSEDPDEQLACTL